MNVALRDGLPFSSRVISDGTLRVLALLTMLHDPKHGGLVCFEEPENGVHPMRLRRLIQRLRQLVTDPESIEPTGEPLTQILMNSHSPVVLAALKVGRALPIDVVFVDVIGSADPQTGGLNAKNSAAAYPRGLPHGDRRAARRARRGRALPGDGRHRRMSPAAYLRLLLYAEGKTDYRLLLPLLRRLTEQVCLDSARGIVDVEEVAGIDSEAKGDRATRIVDAARGFWGGACILFIHADGAGDPERMKTEQVAPSVRLIEQTFRGGACVPVVPVRELATDMGAGRRGRSSRRLRHDARRRGPQDRQAPARRREGARSQAGAPRRVLRSRGAASETSPHGGIIHAHRGTARPRQVATDPGVQRPRTRSAQGWDRPVEKLTLTPARVER